MSAIRRIWQRSFGSDPLPPLCLTPNPDAIHGVALVDDDADLDAWASAQVDDAYIELTRDYLTHCFSLDPAPHDHRNHS